jgi:hypothetical protein
MYMGIRSGVREFVERFAKGMALLSLFAGPYDSRHAKAGLRESESGYLA